MQASEGQGASSSRYEVFEAQRHAKKLADQALRNLSLSRQEVERSPINTPTWTGSRGVAGLAPVRGRFGNIVRSSIGQGYFDTCLFVGVLTMRHQQNDQLQL